MTPGLETLSARLVALVDERILNVQWQYEQRWDEAELSPAMRDWLREVLDAVLRDIRQDVIALLRDLPATREP